MRLALRLALFSAAAPVYAAPVQYLAATPTPAADGGIAVDLVLLNNDDVATSESLPQRLDAELGYGAARRSAALQRAPDQPSAVTIPPHGFARVRYLLPSGSAVAAGTILAIPSHNLRVALDGASPAAEQLAASPPPLTEAAAATPARVARGNDFLGNLAAYQPIYAVYGPGTNSDARLQISFQYQLFGDPLTPPAERGLLDGVRFAYTQRMFWDLGRRSSPFRNVDYMPEVFYLAPDRAIGRGVTLGGQAGFLHQSNGRDGAASRSFNTLYVQPAIGFAAGRYRVQLGPRLLTYVGSLSDNPDIKRYRGHTALRAQIDRDDGFRLAATGRLATGSGRGAVDAEMSYPLTDLIGSGPNLYIFGQGFTGYGENLLDYRRRQTRLRIGFGIVR